ncbi:hypothetical protein P691DRAFT_778592 [Macrolepiota fuliginosa MF-IS2]|uniref:F-box domain-containing protein n=1 Tax=Macrolepiota fuliginosa MF-IS2 TaxID=1400762 RepID=A0A9P6BZU7_9AGAR|nr:hypothetical protein P691DRAFT_778592 [Macrolepiota fuliginosa MF-IS2]
MVHLVLPLEIVDEIIRLSPRSVQLSFCRTSHLFRSLATRSLYANVSLDSSSSLIRLCTTLSSNLTAAICVKHLSIHYTQTEPPNTVYLAAFYRIFKNALLNLLHLQDFRLLVSDLHIYHTIFSRATTPLWFPSLRHFETYLPLTSPLLNFIERHPKLAYLEVSHYECFNSDGSHTLYHDRRWAPRKPALLNLHHFVGNSAYMSTLAPDYPLSLRTAYLIWDAVKECQGPIKALAHTSSHSLNVLTCRRRGWNVDLVGCIASYLSDIYALRIINVVVVDAPLSQDFQDSIAHHLSRFRRLQHLKMTRQTQWCPTEVCCDLDQELSIVTEWGMACPSLQTIVLPHSEPGIEWRRIGANLWVPIDVSSHETARSWLRDSVRGRKSSRLLKNSKQHEDRLLHSFSTNP